MNNAMERILSEEELNALLELFQTGLDRAESPEEKGSMVEHEVQRRFFRLTQNLPAILRTRGGSHPAEAVNIGLGGIFIRSSLELPVDLEVELDLDLPSPWARVALRGHVCWRKQSAGQVIGLGIRFSSLPTEAIWAIIANIEQARG